MPGEDERLRTPVGNKIMPALKRTSSYAFEDSPFVVPPSPMMKRLGCGTSITVYRYKRQKCSGVAASPWAIKKANKGKARTPIINRLTTEGEILRQLDHPNIVAFKKLTQTENGDVCLSMEAFGKGLDDIIYKHQDSPDLFTAHQVMKVTWCMCNALNYLHNTKKLLHGDIKSGNVLVKGDFLQVKLCDFGVSIFLNDDLCGAKNPKDYYIGSEPWHSKEVINGDIITDKADIFAYGLVIWEMLALDVPHVALMDEDSFNESSVDTNESIMSSNSSHISEKYLDALGTRPPLPVYEYSTEYDPAVGTFICCTSEDYTKRPNAAKIVDTLSTIISEYGIV